MLALQALSQWAMSTTRLIRISAFHAELALIHAPQALFLRNRMSYIQRACCNAFVLRQALWFFYSFWRSNDESV